MPRAALNSSDSGVPGSRSDRPVASVPISSVVRHGSLRFPKAAVAVPAVSAPDVRPGPRRVAEEVLATPLQFDLEFRFQSDLAPGAINNHALLRLLLHLLKCKRIADHIAGDLARAL